MSAIGALVGLALAIVLIFRKVSPVYSLMAGALAGGLVGGSDLVATVSMMTSGVNDVVPAVVRILAAGVLSGVLIETGAADTISRTIVDRLGSRHVALALALATMLLTATVVFIDVAVITVAPIGLVLSQRLGVSSSKMLVMMIGGGKCGNIISPNPNTIIAAENFGADLYSTMVCNIVAAVIGLIFTVYLIGRLVPDTGRGTVGAEMAEDRKDAPGFLASIAGPVVTVVLLALRPLAGVTVDPLVALPVGGLTGLIVMGRAKRVLGCLSLGLGKMTPVAVLLIATGTIAGVIKASDLSALILSGLGQMHVADVLLAPLAGILMSAATASTTAGAAVASSSFAPAILDAGVAPAWGAAMVNAGSTVVDHLPHGSFFHATGGAAELSIKQRMKLIPYESAIGLVLAAVSTLSYIFLSSVL
ncbi:MAG: GntP family permease [Muribaculaceae bacterium]|nr:GntP family permease [Muribaculaceae bacterium]